MSATGGAPPPAPTRASVISNSLGVAAATGAYGVSFGAVGVAAGLSVAQTCALSLLLFSGASQFALAGVVASGGAPLAGALSAVLLGTRNALYGIRLGPLLGLRGWRRFVGAQVVIDESTAMAVGQPGPELARVGFWTTGVGVFVLWNTATAIGAVVGDTLGDPRAYGLDAAVSAAFLALLWPRLSTPAARLAALLAAALAIGAVPLAPAGVPVLLSVVVALALGVRR
ncbi:MAG TPA: AzlC family ABC transporter permease [Nocardioidaceae bacterium]|nr:AzlC family ABC transporter permease [Nocardioidaceae bacterium]